MVPGATSRARFDLAVVACVTILGTAVLSQVQFHSFLHELEETRHLHWLDTFVHGTFVLALSLLWYSYRRGKEERTEFAKRIRTEEAALHRETQTRAILDNMPVLLNATDKEGRFLYWNEECERVTGYSAEEVIGNANIWNQIYPDVEYRHRMIQEAKRRDNDYRDWEWELTCKDGTRRIVSWSNISTRIPVEGWESWGIGIDLTNLRNAEASLRHRLDFEGLIVTLSTHFIELKPDEVDAGIAFALERVGEFSGVDRSYLFLFLENGSYIDYSYEWCAEGIEPQIGTIQKVPCSDLPYVTGQLKAGHVFHVPRVADLPPEAAAEKAEFGRQSIRSLVCVPMATAGEVIGFVGFDSVREEKVWGSDAITVLRIVGEILGNVLRRKFAEESLLERNVLLREFSDRLQLLHRIGNVLSRIESLDDLCRQAVEQGISTLGYDRLGLWFFDRETEDLIGTYGTDESGGIRDERGTRNSQWRQRFMAEIPEEEGRYEVYREVPLFDCDHRQVGIGTFLFAPLWDGKEVLGFLCCDNLLTGRDYSERDAQILALFASTVGYLCARRRADEERLQLESQVQQTQKLESLGVLAGGIAHDFNNLLVSILGNAGLARDDLAPTSPARDSLREIETAAKRAADLCRQMLAYSGRGRFLIEALDLNSLVREMSHLLEVSISKKALLKFNLTDPLPSIEADATQIRQVVMNLITNASEAIGDSSGVIRLSTGFFDCDQEYLNTVYLEADLKAGKYVYLEVTDTGCGMDAETASKIFDPFYTTKFTGRGLGLAAVLGIVRGHHGALKVYTEIGKGTTFKILLPTKVVSASSGSDQPPPFVDWKTEGKALLVDDEENVRRVGKRMLERMGFEVETAADGIEALKLFQGDPEGYRVILLDLTMPHMDGEETFRELRRLNRQVRVVVSSGYSEQEVVDRFAGKGLAGFIQKPFQWEDLVAAVRRVLPDSADVSSPESHNLREQDEEAR